MILEVKPSGDKDKPWGLFVNGVLLGTAKLQCDAQLAMHTLERFSQPRTGGSDDSIPGSGSSERAGLLDAPPSNQSADPNS